AMPDDTQICNCNTVSKGTILAAIQGGAATVDAVGQACKAGTGCGTCQPLLGQLLASCGKGGAPAKNKIEIMKEEKDGLDCLDDLFKLVPSNNWQAMTENDQHRAKWHGRFFRKQTPGNVMMRLR